MTISNVIFDIGNVIVRWDPRLIVERTFGEERASDDFIQSIFPGEGIWLPLNRGEISAREAMRRYQQKLDLTVEETDRLWFQILETMEPVSGTIELMDTLQKLGIRLFALSDNVHEIVTHLKSTYDFWRYFDDAVISAEVGMLKPETEIYLHLLTNFAIKAEETVFFDDVPKNVEGANSVGIKGILFSTADKAAADLQNLGLNLKL